MTANRIADAQKQLDTLIRTAYAKAFPGKEMRDFIIEIPKDTSHGDFASNAAMVNAKNAGKAPRDIAAALLEHVGDYSLAGVPDALDVDINVEVPHLIGDPVEAEGQAVFVRIRFHGEDSLF